jgi:hypothetical protein
MIEPFLFLWLAMIEPGEFSLLPIINGHYELKYSSSTLLIFLLHCSSDQLPPQVKQSVLSSFPHYGHAGIVESARELYTKLEGQPIHQG